MIKRCNKCNAQLYKRCDVCGALVIRFYHKLIVVLILSFAGYGLIQYIELFL